MVQKGEDMQHNNLKFLRKRQGLTQAAVAEKLGLSQATVVAFEKGEKSLNEPQKEILARLFEVSKEDLFKADINIKPASVSIDMLDVTACCGDGNEDILERVIGSWTMPAEEFQTITYSKPKSIKLLRVKGDSMEPTLKNGDWVMVDTSYLYPDADGMFLLYMATGLAVKRIQSGINDIIVRSDNPKYGDIKADIGEIRIVGKVIYILSALKVG